MKGKYAIAILSPNPILIKKKLGYTGPIEETGITIMASSDYLEFGYDRDTGEVKVILNVEHIQSSLVELRIWMTAKNISLVKDGKCTVSFMTLHASLEDRMAMEKFLDLDF